jgi:hypothetical protein
MCPCHLMECVTEPACHGPWPMGCSPLFQELAQPVHDRCVLLPMMASVCSLSSDMLGPTQDISRHLELQQYKEQLEVLLESKLSNF